LNQTAQATLAKQASWLQQYGRYNVTVEGHADERGTREYNFALGARRAETTKDYLVARGIPASKFILSAMARSVPSRAVTTIPVGRKTAARSPC